MAIDRAVLWRQLKEGLTHLLDSMAPQLAAEDRKLVMEFIDNREFGLALEWLHSVIAEKNLRPSASEASEIQRLAALMHIELP
ncbi:MafI family immunity protein [Bradyrhizobium sp. WSM3983]|uniref:MafI family immunity protein n=1 Tax=Bradyrhizobium sp. WSM3983 TaxID=1038867 RepID=UPI000481DA7A|nr:MafI family immunity protein [Bradyrhizobium sp. WSM3983]